MAQRATSLGPLFVVSFVFFVLALCFGGFKGQVRWPKGPPHLALNPICFLFPLFAFNRKKNCFSPQKVIFVYFSESPFVSP